MAKRKKIVTCGRCKAGKPRAEFTENDRLHDGCLPWCMLCLEWLRSDGTHPDREAYQKSYQGSYQKRYRHDNRITGGKNYRGRKFTKALVERTIATIDLVSLRNEEVQAQLFGMWHDLRRSNVWQEFEDLCCDRADSDGEVVRIMDEFRYPELALAEANCVVVDRGESLGDVRVELGPSDCEEGLRRLRAAILEVLS